LFPVKSEEKRTEVEQKIQISFIWIEENSYCSSKESVDYIKDITETENITKDWNRHEECESTSMILHYHPNLSAQERRKDSNAEPLKFSLKHAYPTRLLSAVA
jgi:acetyl-CoA carboxylase beta subunit